MIKMKFFSLSNFGVGDCSFKELNKFGVDNIELSGQSVIFDVKNKLADANNTVLSEIFQKNQSLISLNVYLSEFVEEFSLDSADNLLKELFGTEIKELSFKIEFEGVKGQDARTELARKIYDPLISKFKDLLSIELKKDFKIPELVFQVYFTGEKYLFGLKLNKENFDSRKFRLFSHQASFKGDFAYRILQESEIGSKDKVLFMFSKDSTLAIESVFMNNKINVRKISNKDYVWNIPYFAKLLEKLDLAGKVNESIQDNIFVFDTASPNIRASKNNAKIAGVLDYIKFKNASLEDLDIQYEKSTFDKICVHMTKKDEANLNEIYHQSFYLIKEGGKLIFITRATLDLVILDKFELVSEKTLERGDCSYKLWVLVKE